MTAVLDDILGTLRNDAMSRGQQWALDFYNSSEEDKILHLAQIIYVCVSVDPYGYPNGRAYFDELPDIDHNHTVGDDKARYIQAATSVYSRLMWKPESQ